MPNQVLSRPGANPKHTLLELLRAERARYLGALAALLAATALSLLVPLVAKGAIDDVARGTPNPLARLLRAAVLMVALAAASGVFVYLRGRLAAEAAERISRTLRERLFDRLQRMHATGLDRVESGDIVQRCSSDVETVRTFVGSQVVEVGRAVLLVIVVLPLLLRLDPTMTAVAVCLFPAIIGFAVFFFRRIQGSFLSVDEAEGGMTAALHENLTGVRVVRAFAREEFEREKFARRNVTYRDRWARLVALLANYWALSDLLAAGQIGLVVLVGASRLRSGAIGPGAFYAFLSYAYMLIEPIRHLGRTLSEMGKARVSIARVREVLEAAIEQDDECATEPAAPSSGRVVFHGVSFAHGTTAVLHDISFTLEPGEVLAVLGPPGSGKSTIVQLLLRFYDPEQGRIELDGRDVRTLPRTWLRRQVGCVLQEPFLFSRSLRDNLLFARPAALEAEVQGAAETACVHEAIAGFERGYETLVGERGVTLSGGQRQRVALARALLQDPPVLLLDDALSAVDTETEGRILDALRTRRTRRSTIVIAHRLSTVAHADRVLVLDRGRAVQAGTPSDLLLVEGPYRRLWLLQSDLEEEIRRDLGARAGREGRDGSGSPSPELEARIGGRT